MVPEIKLHNLCEGCYGIVAQNHALSYTSINQPNKVIFFIRNINHIIIKL